MLNYLKKINAFLLRNNVFNNVSFNINSLDNPGWVIRLDLSETNYESNKNILINKYNFGDDWIDCGFNKLNRKVIEGGGDPSKLSKILEYVFLAINDSNLNYVHSNELNEESEFNIIDWLEKWYISWCNNNYNYFNEDFDIDVIFAVLEDEIRDLGIDTLDEVAPEYEKVHVCRNENCGNPGQFRKIYGLRCVNHGKTILYYGEERFRKGHLLQGADEDRKSGTPETHFIYDQADARWRGEWQGVLFCRRGTAGSFQKTGQNH